MRGTCLADRASKRRTHSRSVQRCTSRIVGVVQGRALAFSSNDNLAARE